MNKNSKPLGIPETVGVGFVLGVAGGLVLGGAGGMIAFCALAGSLVIPLLRATLTLRLPNLRTPLKRANASRGVPVSYVP